MLDLSKLDKKTGEIIEGRPDVPFRSLTDLKQYKDDEQYEPGTSMVDETGYEPLASIVARCMRTMKAPNGQLISVLDKTALKAEESQVGVYEASSATSVDEAFATQDPTDDPDFDLSDASRFLAQANDNIKQVLAGTSDNQKSRSEPDKTEDSSEKDESVKEEIANG